MEQAERALIKRLLDLCDAAESDNYGRLAVDVSDAGPRSRDHFFVRNSVTTSSHNHGRCSVQVRLGRHANRSARSCAW